MKILYRKQGQSAHSRRPPRSQRWAIANLAFAISIVHRTSPGPVLGLSPLSMPDVPRTALAFSDRCGAAGRSWFLLAIQHVVLMCAGRWRCHWSWRAPIPPSCSTPTCSAADRPRRCNQTQIAPDCAQAARLSICGRLFLKWDFHPALRDPSRCPMTPIPAT